jgi:hypothetical protein
MRRFIPLLAVVLIGCGVNPGVNPEPVDISGRVTLAGRPVSDVTFNLQATGAGTQAMYPVKAGEFRGKATPGRYTWYLSEGSNASAFRAIPGKYRQGAMDRQIDVGAGSALDLKLD